MVIMVFSQYLLEVDKIICKKEFQLQQNYHCSLEIFVEIGKLWVNFIFFCALFQPKKVNISATVCMFIPL